MSLPLKVAMTSRNWVAASKLIALALREAAKSLTEMFLWVAKKSSIGWQRFLTGIFRPKYEFALKKC